MSKIRIMRPPATVSRVSGLGFRVVDKRSKGPECLTRAVCVDAWGLGIGFSV